jgi:hypothetical protein
MRLALILLCGQLWAQSVPLSNITTRQGDFRVSDGKRDLLNCTMDNSKQGVIKACTLSDGIKLEEVFQMILDVQSACYTRDGVMVRLNRGESSDDCMYNGATFRDWDKRATVLESSRRTCRKNKGREAPYFDPILRKTDKMSCSVLLRSK